MASSPTIEDEGKPIVSENGTVLGYTERVREGIVLVRPEAGVLDGFGAWISGPDHVPGPFRLDTTKVTRIDDEAIVIRGDDDTVVGATPNR